MDGYDLQGDRVALRPDDEEAYHYHVASLPEEELTTERQRERRSRILDAAVSVAGAGGYDRVHMRTIADEAGVAMGTLYHYFPSKVHLLVMALERELIRFDEFLSADLSAIDDPISRLRLSVWSLINAMEHSDRVTHSLTHAYVASHVVASVEAEMIRRQTAIMFIHVMAQGYSAETNTYAAIADLITDVWTSEVLALVQGRRTFSEMRSRLGHAIDIVGRSAERRPSRG